MVETARDNWFIFNSFAHTNRHSFREISAIPASHNLNAIFRNVVIAILKPKSVMIANLVSLASVASAISHPRLFSFPRSHKNVFFGVPYCHIRNNPY
jgi:hypothetical protein